MGDKIENSNWPQEISQNNEIDQNKTVVYNTGTNTTILKTKNGETFQSPNLQTQKKNLIEGHAADSTKDPQSKHLSPAENTSPNPGDFTTNNNTHIEQGSPQNTNLNASTEEINNNITLDPSPKTTQEVNGAATSIQSEGKKEDYGGVRVSAGGISTIFRTKDNAEAFKKECEKFTFKNEEQAAEIWQLGPLINDHNLNGAVASIGHYMGVTVPGFATGNEENFQKQSIDKKQFWNYQTPDKVKITAIKYLKELQSAVEPVINHLEVKLLLNGLLSPDKFGDETLNSKLKNEILNNNHNTFKKGTLDKIKEFFSWLFHIKSFIQKRDNEIKKLKLEILNQVTNLLVDNLPNIKSSVKNNPKLIKILDEALKNTRYVNEKTAKAVIENFCSEIGEISSSDSFLLPEDIEKLADLSLKPEYQIFCRERAIGGNDSGSGIDRGIMGLSMLDLVFAPLLKDSDGKLTVESLHSAEQKFGKDVLDKIVRATCMNDNLRDIISKIYQEYYKDYRKEEICPKLQFANDELHKLLSESKRLGAIIGHKPQKPKKPTKPEEPKNTNQDTYQFLLKTYNEELEEYKKKAAEYSKQLEEYEKKKEDYDKKFSECPAALEEVKNQLEEYKRNNGEIDEKTHTWKLISGNITVVSNVEVENSDEDPVPSIKLWNIPYFVDAKLENSQDN